MDKRQRAAFGVVAIAALAGEILFVIANAHAFGSLSRSLWWTTSFLTDWSAFLVAAVASMAALWTRGVSPFWLGLATVAATLVAIMFAALGGWENLGASSLQSPLGLSSMLAHVVYPLGLLAAWVFVAEHGSLRAHHALKFMAFPALYLLQMFARGALGDGFPYPEVDAARVGWLSALIFAGVVTILFGVIGLLVVAVDRWLDKFSSVRNKK